MSENVLTIRDLSVDYQTDRGVLKAMRHINLDISKGSIKFAQQNLLKLSEDDMRKIRGTRLSIVFQDPMSTLNPVLSIGKQMTDI